MGTQPRASRPKVSEQTEAWIGMVRERLEGYNGDNSERDQGHYDGLIEALALMMQAQVTGGDR